MLPFQAAVRCLTFKRKCAAGPCQVIYSGQEDCIFFLSRQTGVCDEIGWDFVASIVNTKCSFTAFCNEKTRIYQSNNSMAHPFLSRSTFLSWWFAWLAAHKIDFRKDVDRWCAQSRKVLGGDGTHVGVTLTNLNVMPVESPTIEDVVEPGLKRYDRVFLPYPARANRQLEENIRGARVHLRYLAAQVLGRPLPHPLLNDEELRERNGNLLTVCPQEPYCLDLLALFVNGNLDHDLMKVLADVFIILSGDAAVSSFVPYRFLHRFTEVCDSFQDGVSQQSLRLVDLMLEFCPELSHVIRTSVHTDVLDVILNFVRYLVSFVQRIHTGDLPSSAAVPIPFTYDPESGVAYYFTEHGCRVREIPHYAVNFTRHTADLYDDAPVHDTCNKCHPRVSSGGFNYTFFWFCPIHGHCLGFHLMPESEGRKDPFSSLYAYLPEPPKEIFYDFACSLSEYSLNREPHFFRETRFWHDLFHGFSHKCASSLKSSRIPSLNVLDTEICEQFNSFLQNIKYTGSHLTQSHFCLYLQFMIHIWNMKKDGKWNRVADVARIVNVIDQ